MTRSRTFAHASLAAIAAAASTGLAIPEPAFGQSVADRTLSDVRVDNVGGCTTLTVNFNIRLQVLSHFPTQGGREVHVRIRPLDAATSGMLRESLRTPASVPELRSIEFEGDNPSGPVLSLFFTRDMRFEVAAGSQPQSLVIRLAEPGSGPICDGRSPAAPSMPRPSADGSPQAAPAPGIAIPAGLYAINALSVPKAIGTLSEAQQAALAGQVVYETSFERDSQKWYRLRSGFYETREAAEAARAKLLAVFPEAWVVKVTASERAQGVTARIASPAQAAAGSAGQASEADIAETARLVGDAEIAIRDQNPDRAVALLTNALAKPENANTPRALELLALTRERKGQTAHAQADYEEYLRRYPTGEASDRVRQRLSALTAPAAGTTPELRQASGAKSSAWVWNARGSFSQFYFRDQSTTRFVDAARPTTDPDVDNSVNLNQLLTAADMTISGGNDQRQIQMRAAGSFTKNFRSGGKNIKTLTALYADYSDSTVGAQIRLGRQTRNSSGVLGRFDGVLVGWQAKPKLRFNAVGGMPVLSSRQTHLLKDRYFYGFSADIGSRQSALQTTVYWFDQRARGGFVDRRSVGVEARFLKPRFNAFTIVDYDVKFRTLNLGLLSLNYNFPDSSNISVTADYRRSPLLTTSNALIGQMDSVALQPITDLRGLRPFFTDPQIYRLAKDRSLVAKSLTASYSRPLSKKLQISADISVNHSGGTPETPASVRLSDGSPGTGPVSGQPSTGTEYYYGAQLIGSGMLWESDIYILSGRYSDTQRSSTWTADFNARVPITSKFRLSPRLRYGQRHNKLDAGSFRQFQPTLRFNYYPMRHSEIEVEFGLNFSRDRAVSGGSFMTTRESGYVLSAGYRIDF